MSKAIFLPIKRFFMQEIDSSFCEIITLQGKKEQQSLHTEKEVILP